MSWVDEVASTAYDSAKHKASAEGLEQALEKVLAALPKTQSQNLKVAVMHAEMELQLAKDRNKRTLNDSLAGR